MNAVTSILPDQFGIGQAKMAEIKMAFAQKAMAEAAPEIIDTRAVTPEWRAMRIRQLHAARAEYEQARRVRIMFEGLH